MEFEKSILVPIRNLENIKNNKTYTMKLPLTDPSKQRRFLGNGDIFTNFPQENL